jgi:hypothetical protein
VLKLKNITWTKFRAFEMTQATYKVQSLSELYLIGGRAAIDPETRGFSTLEIGFLLSFMFHPLTLSLVKFV